MRDTNNFGAMWRAVAVAYRRLHTTAGDGATRLRLLAGTTLGQRCAGAGTAFALILGSGATQSSQVVQSAAAPLSASAAVNPDDSYIAPSFSTTERKSFASWRNSLRETIPSSCEVDVEVELNRFVGRRGDQHLIWQTLRCERGVKQLATWREVLEPDDSSVGKVRTTSLVELGDALDGHAGVVHGGFSAALLDDFLGQTTMAEARARGLSGAPLTASLNLKYLHPVMADSTYLVQCRVEAIERRQRPGPPSWNVMLTATIYDAAGHRCVEATSRYVIKTFE